MKSREEINKIIDIPEWAETILNLHNIELYIFSEIYNTFKNNFRSFEVYDYNNNTNSIIHYLATKLNYSEVACTAAIKELTNRQYITLQNRGTVYQTIKSYLPNMPLIVDILISNGVDENEFLYKLTLNNSTYTISAKTLYKNNQLDIITPHRKGTITVDLGLQDDLDINGIDLLIVSDMLPYANYDNTYHISEELKLLTGLNENELKCYLDSLCEKNIIFKDIFDDTSYHINFELYKVLRFTNYKYQTKLQKASVTNG